MVKKTNDEPEIAKKDSKKKSDFKEKPLTKTELEQALLNNFVNLQKVLTNLSMKFDELSDNISKLLQLFEISAKSFSEKYSDKEGEGNNAEKSDNQLLNKLDSLLYQNKTIARGIMLMEERIRQKQNHPKQPEQQRFQGALRTRPLPRY